MTRLATTITIPVASAAKQENSRRSLRRKGMLTPPLHLPCAGHILTLQDLAFVRSPTQEPSRIISCLLPARGLPAIFFLFLSLLAPLYGTISRPFFFFERDVRFRP